MFTGDLNDQVQSDNELTVAQLKQVLNAYSDDTVVRVLLSSPQEVLTNRSDISDKYQRVVASATHFDEVPNYMYLEVMIDKAMETILWRS
jgi:hypothetical protein